MGMNGPRKLNVIIPAAETVEDLDGFKFAENQEISNLQPPLIVYLYIYAENSGTNSQNGMKD